jgi:hypothetical protein
MKKEAQFNVGRGALGAVGGGLVGRYITPEVFGYEDVEPARNLSTLADAALFGAVAGFPKATWAKFLAKPWAVPSTVGGVVASEALPIGAATMTRGMEQLEQHRDLSEQISDALGSPTARGAAIGAAGAGLGGLLTGLTRPQSERELTSGSGRGEMVTKDILKYLLPALLAGGLGGSLYNPAPKAERPILRQDDFPTRGYDIQPPPPVAVASPDFL